METPMIDKAAQKRDRRNLAPSAPAVFAMWHWHDRYADQTGGSMDFFDSLTKREQQFCRDAVSLIVKARGDY